jgi:hypothetical protein
MESPRNRQAKEGEAPSRLGITQAVGGINLEKKGVQMRSQGPIKGFYTQRYWTCPVKGPDLSGGTPNQTCPVRVGLVW